MLQAFVDQELGGCRELRHLFCGGEVLTGSLVGRCRERLPWVRLHNTYGPTEASIDVTSYDCEHWQEGWVPIGKSLANVQLRVMDHEGNPVPAGVSGELYIGGVQLARGYLGRPGQTAERFVPDAHGEPGGRLYQSGDRVRCLGSGELDFLGRADEQVKIRGYRVELGEIEAVLGQLPQVRECAVLARSDGSQHLLVAYVVSEGERPSVSALRAKLAERLPEHMLPAAFVWLEQMPLTANGKLDRKALPAPERRPELEVDYVAPRNPVELVLAEIWAELLQVQGVGMDDDFFALGGHSLSAMTVLTRARSLFQVNLTLSDILEAPTVRLFARRVSDSADLDTREYSRLD